MAELNNDIEPEFIRKKKVNPNGLQNPLVNILKANLLSIKGRKDRIRNIPIKILPTKFEDDDDPSSEDENGEETSTVRHGVFANQHFEKIRTQCLKNNALFVDPMFPPSNASLFFQEDDWNRNHEIEWKRARELSGDARLFIDGPSRFDIMQGELGDCWLLAAMANLTLNQKLFYHVVPTDQNFTTDYTGLFHFRIWQFGEWTDVVVDDYLPTRHGRLLYMRSVSDNEFWSALLEKAYAKLHGCYEALQGGSTCDAMVDFSGGCSETQELGMDEKDWEEIYRVMRKNYNRSTMIACYMNPDPNVVEAKTDVGLIRGHAYSVTKVVHLKVENNGKTECLPLVRVRNPWGNSAEWKGKWSDGSPEWKLIADHEKAKLGLTFEHDGEFYMSQNDFMKYFEGVEMTHLMPGSLDEEELVQGKLQWNTKQFDGSWIQGKNAGGCRNYLSTFASNPQYMVVLEDSDDDEDDLCTCIIALMQKGTRKKQKENDDILTIGFVAYKLKEPNKTKLPLDTNFFKYNRSCARSATFINAREISGRFKLSPGSYVIIPTTFEPNEEGDFILRIFAEKMPAVKQVQ